MTIVKRPLIIVGIVAILLLIPLMAMQLTNEINWSPTDFLMAGILLTLTGFTIDFIWRKTKSNNAKLIWMVTVIVLFLLIWAEMAVGVFGSPIAGS